MGQQVSVAGADLGLWKRDVTTNRSTAHPGKGKNYVADTEASILACLELTLTVNS